MSEYIVTGATGYIGNVVVNMLLENGYENVKIVTRSNKNISRFIGKNVEFIIGDLKNKEFVNKLIKEDSIVLHLAGIVEIGSKKNNNLHDTNVNGTINIVDACIKNKAKKLIYTSSTSVLASSKHKIIDEPIVEDINKLKGQYEKSKAIATNYILEKIKNDNLNAVILYPSAVIGPYDYNISNIGQVVLDYINERFNVYIKGKYNFVDVRDVAKAIISAIENGKPGNGYILSGEVITVKEMIYIMRERLKHKRRPIKIPLVFVKMGLPFLEMYYKVKDKKPIFSYTTLKSLNQPCNFSNAKAMKELHFNPISAKQSLTDMIDWFKGKV